MTHVDSITSPQIRNHGTVTPAATVYAVEKLETTWHHAPAPVLVVRPPR